MYCFTWTSWFAHCLTITKKVSVSNWKMRLFSVKAKNFTSIVWILMPPNCTYYPKSIKMKISNTVNLVLEYCSGQFFTFFFLDQMKDEMCAWLWRPSNTNWNQRKIDPFGLLLHSSRRCNNQQHSNKKMRQFDRLIKGRGTIFLF